MTNLTDKWPRAKAFRVRTIIDKLQLCGCGSDAHWECVLELLSEAEAHSGNTLAPGGGFYRDKWFEFGAKVLDSWGLSEHGTSIAWAWLTGDGSLLLEFLRDFGTEDYDFGKENGHPLWSIETSWPEVEVEGEPDAYAEWREVNLNKLS